MENIFIYAGIVSIIFLILKFVEMRSVEKESKPLKYLIRDALLVYFSTIAGYFIINQINPIMSKNDAIPNVFMDNPGF
jgi:hypothetical protein